jgi:hypothetical protein
LAVRLELAVMAVIQYFTNSRYIQTFAGPTARHPGQIPRTKLKIVKPAKLNSANSLPHL